MLSVLRDEDAAPADRKWAAQAAAPFVHPRLAAVEHKGNEDNPIVVKRVDDRELARRLLLVLSRLDPGERTLSAPMPALHQNSCMNRPTGETSPIAAS